MVDKIVQRRKGAHEVDSSCTLVDQAHLQQLSTASQLADAGILQNQSDIKTHISIRHFFLASSRLLPCSAFFFMRLGVAHVNIGRPYSERRRKVTLCLLVVIVIVVGKHTLGHELEWQVCCMCTLCIIPKVKRDIVCLQRVAYGVRTHNM